MRDALRKRRQSVLHVSESLNRSTDDYTEVAEFDWAFCTPIPNSAGNSQGLYVAGRLDHRTRMVVDSGLTQAAFGSTDEGDLCQYDMDCDGQINPVDSGIV